MFLPGVHKPHFSVFTDLLPVSWWLGEKRSQRVKRLLWLFPIVVDGKVKCGGMYGFFQTGRAVGMLLYEGSLNHAAPSTFPQKPSRKAETSGMLRLLPDFSRLGASQGTL